MAETHNEAGWVHRFSSAFTVVVYQLLSAVSTTISEGPGNPVLDMAILALQYLQMLQFFVPVSFLFGGSQLILSWLATVTGIVSIYPMYQSSSALVNAWFCVAIAAVILWLAIAIGLLVHLSTPLPQGIGAKYDGGSVAVVGVDS